MTRLYKQLLPAFCAITILFSCSENINYTKLSESGVSIELANLRKSGFSNVTYQLFFNIPKIKDLAVTANCTINLNVDKSIYKTDLIIDFKTDKSNIVKVEYNNGKTQYTFNNEHIIIPAKEIINGNNTICIDFIANNSPLNRNDEFLYTLLVPDRARTLFPCFDQPNIKARYTLSTKSPKDWVTITNSAKKEETIKTEGGDTLKIENFSTTEPLSSYLFSFVCGKFNISQQQCDSNINSSLQNIRIYHREDDENKIAQLGDIATQVFKSLEWMEDYTAIKFPFSKYDLIIIPGFQFGGMEHTGATLYNASTMFLPKNPTLQNEISRTELIAHETAHMWFGDYVTMDWFSGVWVKEVFAGFFASRIIRPLYPNINYDINDFSFYTSAYAEDRTQGTTSIQQELPNLKYAGLIYGNIIYKKSPVFMDMLYNKMGADNFREAIREYLNTYSYSNASWDNLADIFAKHQPKELIESKQDIKSWSKYWVYGKGMPQITFNKGKVSSLEESGQSLQIDTINGVALPNLNGKFYGYIKIDSLTANFMLENIYNIKEALGRKSILTCLYENALRNNLSAEKYLEYLCSYLYKETDPQIFPSILSYIHSLASSSLSDINSTSSSMQEYACNKLLSFIKESSSGQYATQALRTLSSICSNNNQCLNFLYNSWKDNKDKKLTLSANDLISLSYKLAILLPENRNEIYKIQKERITNNDKLKEFEFIFAGTDSNKQALDSLFNSLLIAQNRKIEPWAQSLLGLLNYHTRQKDALKYILPALEAMEDVQQTGDIFFPKNWISSVLSGHHSPEAENIVNEYLANNPQLLQLLKNKILQSKYYINCK